MGARGVAERVHFLGSLDHTLLPVVLSAADAMVLPSASEGLANAWVEALACGCPLVISDAGGAFELMTTPEAGRIVAREPVAIAEAVRALLADPPGRDAVAATVERFSWPAHAEALENLREHPPEAVRPEPVEGSSLSFQWLRRKRPSTSSETEAISPLLSLAAGDLFLAVRAVSVGTKLCEVTPSQISIGAAA